MAFLKKAHMSHDFELNLTAIIDCFVTLICFLLLSATYVNLVGLDGKVPVAVTASSEEAKKKSNFKLEMTIKKNGIQLVATDAGKASGKRFIAALKGDPKAGVKHDLATLHNELVKIKREKPKEFSIYFVSEVEMAYEELVRYMDTTRNLEPADGALTVIDERNGQQEKLDTLFPDFVMANLGEGK